MNPAAQIERLRERRQADIDVFTSEEVWVLGERAGGGDGSALRRRHIAALDRAASAGCASTTFATTVGTRVIAKADIVRVAAARQRVTSCAPRATLDRPPIKAGVPADE